jgi:hypothetical protein
MMAIGIVKVVGHIVTETVSQYLINSASLLPPVLARKKNKTKNTLYYVKTFFTIITTAKHNYRTSAHMARGM